MRIELVLLMIGMGAVTYIPRLLPSLFMDKLNINPRAERFLKLIPYTAMAAMIVPGIFTVDPSRPEIGIVGGIIAGILAWKRAPILVCVIGAIAADVFLYLL